jgi:antitoxin HicB
MAIRFWYKLERQRNGWWLVRFPGIPEALTEGETKKEARRNAADCVIAALEGYMKADRPLPRQAPRRSRLDRAMLPPLVAANFAAHEAPIT